MKKYIALTALALSGLLATQAALIVKYDFESVAGTTVTDGSGNGRNGTLTSWNTGSYNPTTGPAGTGDTAYEFNDAKDTANAYDPRGAGVLMTLPDITGSYTFAYSIRRDGAQDAAGNAYVLGNGDSTIKPSFFQTSDTLRIQVAYKSIDVVLADGEWMHITTTYQACTAADAADGVLTVYANGTQAGQVSGVNFNATRRDDLNGGTVTASALSLGVEKANGYRPFNGALDNFIVYDEVLDSTAVNSLYASTIPEPATLGLLSIGGLLTLLVRRIHS